MRKTLLTSTIAAAAALGFAAAPAHAATGDVDRPFAMTYGNSQTSGTIHFTSGYTASVSGVVHAASGQRAICADAYNGTAKKLGFCSPWAYAGGPDQVLNESLSIPLPGGVQRVVIEMMDENGKTVASEFCTRTSCTRTV